MRVVTSIHTRFQSFFSRSCWAVLAAKFVQSSSQDVLQSGAMSLASVSLHSIQGMAIIRLVKCRTLKMQDRKMQEHSCYVRHVAKCHEVRRCRRAHSPHTSVLWPVILLGEILMTGLQFVLRGSCSAVWDTVLLEGGTVRQQTIAVFDQLRA